MTKATSSKICSRQLESKEIPRSCAGLDHDEDILLTLLRFFLESFAFPQSQSWVRSIDCAAHYFGADKGAIITQRLLYALDALRSSRRSDFRFNAPSCSACSAIITEDERRFMTAVIKARRGIKGPLAAELMLLCEGNDITLVMECVVDLCDALPPHAPCNSFGKIRA